MRFHSDDYVNFLRVVNPDNASSMIKQQIQCTWWFPLREP